MSARAFGATISYRVVSPELISEPDTRPVSALPSVSFPAVDSAEARDAQLLAEGQRLESQGYRVERVERWNECRKCYGAGTIAVRPKGWRKKSAPPWYAMKRQACPECGGHGAEHIVESMTELLQSAAI